MKIFYINGFSIYQIILYFAIYAFIGWCSEVLYAYHVRGTFVNRGFLHGPFCPIYGCSITLVIVSLNNFRNNIFLLFILSVILTSILEYLTGYILEKFFKAKWWDYTDDPFNLHGRICLFFSIIWGIACLIIFKIIQPVISFFTNKIPNKMMAFISLVIILYFMIDLAFTIKSLIEFNSIINQLTLIKEQFFSHINSLHLTAVDLSAGASTELESYLSEVKDKYTNTLSKFKKNHLRLLNSFPHGGFNKATELLNDIKNILTNIYNKK